MSTTLFIRINTLVLAALSVTLPGLCHGLDLNIKKPTRYYQAAKVHQINPATTQQSYRHVEKISHLRTNKATTTANSSNRAHKAPKQALRLPKGDQLPNIKTLPAIRKSAAATNITKTRNIPGSGNVWSRNLNQHTGLNRVNALTKHTGLPLSANAPAQRYFQSAANGDKSHRVHGPAIATLAPVGSENSFKQNTLSGHSQRMPFTGLLSGPGVYQQQSGATSRFNNTGYANTSALGSGLLAHRSGSQRDDDTFKATQAVANFVPEFIENGSDGQKDGIGTQLFRAVTSPIWVGPATWGAFQWDTIHDMATGRSTPHPLMGARIPTAEELLDSGPTKKTNEDKKKEEPKDSENMSQAPQNEVDTDGDGVPDYQEDVSAENDNSTPCPHEACPNQVDGDPEQARAIMQRFQGVISGGHLDPVVDPGEQGLPKDGPLSADTQKQMALWSSKSPWINPDPEDLEQQAGQIDIGAAELRLKQIEGLIYPQPETR